MLLHLGKLHIAHESVQDGYITVFTKLHIKYEILELTKLLLRYVLTVGALNLDIILIIVIVRSSSRRRMTRGRYRLCHHSFEAWPKSQRSLDPRIYTGHSSGLEAEDAVDQ